MRDGVVDSPPSGDRSSVGLSPEGSLDIRRVEFFGTWRGLGQRRTLTDMNQAPKQNAISLFTPSYGATTPAQAGVSEIVLQPFPPAVPNTDLTGTVVGFSGVGGSAIPRDGAVLVARGTAAQRLVEEAPIGSTVTIRMILRPDWAGIPNAVGGGPVIVRNGGPVFRANEAFSSYQLAPRHPRTAVGQLADGRILMVVVDGRRPGYSVGMTNFELAQALVRLGAVNASALDGGGSSAMAFNGSLLSRPSSGEQATSTALQLMYYGVYAPTPHPVHLTERRRRRRAAARALVQGRAPVERDRDARRPGQRDRLHRDGRPRARHVSGRLPAGAARSDGSARAARRGPLAARRDGNRRPRPDLDHEPVVHGQLDARVREALAPLADRARPRQADDSGGRHAHASRTACSPPSRPSRACASPRSPCGASRRAASSPAGRERPSAAVLSSTAASTRSGSGRPTSSASWSSRPRPSA